MRLLYAIAAFNRMHLLVNTVESVRAFGPEGDILIVDDGSDDPSLLEYYNQLEENKIATVIRSDRSKDSDMHGGLYVSMTKATQYAIENNYDYIYFLQDDVQFMWKDEQLMDRVANVFEQCPDASMVNPTFQKKLYARNMKERLIPKKQGNCWYLTPYGIADIGIMQVKTLKEKNFRFDNTETKNHEQWTEWGYKFYCLNAPVLAWVPWPRTYNRDEAQGKDRKAKRKYFMKPLSQSNIKKLQSATLEKIPYHEDYCFPWGWWCLSPYCYTILNMEYWNALRKAVKRLELIPHPVIRF